MQRVPFRIFPAYSQFYLEDPDGPQQAPEDIPTGDFVCLTRPGLVAVYPAEQATVSGEVLTYAERPRLHRKGWDRVAECGLLLTTNRLGLRAPCEATWPLPGVWLEPGPYRVRVSSRDAFEWRGSPAEDDDARYLEFFRFQVWPGEGMDGIIK